MSPKPCEIVRAPCQLARTESAHAKIRQVMQVRTFEHTDLGRSADGLDESEGLSLLRYRMCC